MFLQSRVLPVVISSSYLCSVEDAINAALSPSRAKIMLETAAVSGDFKSDLAITPSRPSFMVEDAAIELQNPPTDAGSVAAFQVVPVDVTDGAGVSFSNPMHVAAPPPPPAAVNGSGSGEAPVVTNPMHAREPSAASEPVGSGPAAADSVAEAQRRPSKTGGIGFLSGEHLS